MKILSTLTVFCGLALCFFVFTGAAVIDEPTTSPAFNDGKEAYEQHCAECHGVKSAKITPTTKKDSDKGADLGGIGEKYQANWIKRYVKEEVDRDGKSHKKKFKGSDEELQVLVDWLLEQKAEDDDE